MWNNFVNPYYSYYPVAKTGLLSRLTGGLNFSGLLDGAQKTLGVINQAIPVYNQMKPIWSNAKTMFKIADGLRSTPTSVNNVSNTTIPTSTNQISSPNFFN